MNEERGLDFSNYYGLEIVNPVKDNFTKEIPENWLNGILGRVPSYLL